MTEPYYQDDLVTLYHGDCLELLPSISADLVFTSPPYNKGRQSGAYANMRDGYRSFSDSMPDADYVRWQQEVLSALWASVAPSGAVFYNHKPQIRDGLTLLPTRYLPDEALLRQVIIWDRKVGMNWSPTHFCPQHEWVLLLAHPGFRLKSRGASAPGDVWTISIDQTSGDEHPCAFPERLPATAIAATTARTILDPFAGSGTTLRVAKDHGRRAIGIEVDERYCEITARRLAQDVFDFGGAA